MKASVWAIAAGIVWLIGAIVGYGVKGYFGADALADAKRDAATAEGQLTTCRGAASTQQAALDRVQQLAADRLQELQALRTGMSAALDARDAALTQIQQQTQARERAVQQVTHESSDCQQLAVLPVCPAVARRLWGEVARTDTPATYSGAH